jgi:hypothetical protein
LAAWRGLSEDRPCLLFLVRCLALAGCLTRLVTHVDPVLRAGPRTGSRATAILFGVVLRSLVAVMHGMDRVAVSEVRLMRRVLVVLFFIVLGSLAMVFSRLFVMMGG